MLAPLSSVMQTAQSFADISCFLRQGVADEESRELRDSIGALALHIDAAVRARRRRSHAEAIARSADALALGVLEHQLFLSRMGTGWKLLYEFGAYYRALRELAAAVTRWQQALEQRSALEGANFDQVELLAWRTLGEGLLLVDMYRQGVRDLGHRFLADDCRHVGFAPGGRQRRGKLGDTDHRFVDGVFGLVQVGCDFLGCRNSFIQHFLFP